ncbi:MAG: MotA/TolQ/ExbB proton channel family protein [bacterium]
MDFSTVLGLLLGVLCIFGAFLLEGGQVQALVIIPALIIVFGGTFAAAAISFSFEKIRLLPKLVLIALRHQDFHYQEMIERLTNYSTTARRDGLLALERELPDLREETFLHSAVQHLLDGVSPEVLKSLLEEEKSYIQGRHALHASIFHKMGGYSPTMGIIGTVMGLIVTMAGAGEAPSELIRHIATAFIATLWGIFMANLVWLPLSDKLKFRAEEEAILLDIIIQGMYSIQAGENPMVVRNRLERILPPSQRRNSGYGW